MGSTLFSFRAPLGIEVQVTSSVAFLVLLLLMLGGMSASSLILVAVLLGSILLHELGHGWACHVQGIAVRRIVLHGGGGFCEPARAPTPKAQEFISAMGPLVNIGLWAVLSLAAWALVPRTGGLGNFPWLVIWLDLAAKINLLLAIFNLMPVQPLDGGRLLIVVLLRAISRRSATRIAGVVGLAFSVLWFAALIWMFYAGGWVLLFFPSIPLHWAMASGKVTV